jgi:thiol-disulfide isomerase/thioredoxin
MMRSMKGLLCALSLLAAGELSAATDQLSKPAKPLPALVSSGQLSAVANGDLVIYQFWASWCTGCGNVMAQLAKTLESYPKVGYVSVSLDETKDVAMKFFANKPEAAKFALSKSYLDESGKYFAEPSKVDSLPYIIVTKKDGTVIKRFKGHPAQQELESLLKKGA